MPRPSGFSSRDSEHRDSLGRAIKAVRAERGLSRKTVADASGVSYPYLSEIENGRKRASTDALRAIADALDVPAHELFERAEAILPATEFVAAEMAADLLLSPGALEPRAATYTAATMQPRRTAARFLPLRRSSEPKDAALRELAELLARLSREDVERLLDLARRLAR